MKRALFALVALTLVLSASACGGDSEPTREEYAAAVVQARDRTDFAFERIVKAESRTELIERMEEASEAIDAAAGDLEDVEVPQDYRPEGVRLQRQLRQLAFDVGATAEQVQDPRFPILDIAKGISFESWDKVNLQLAGLAGKGIPVVILQPQTRQ